MIVVNNEAIILSILISFLKYFSTSLCKLITSLKIFKRETSEYKRLFCEIRVLKNELQKVDQVNNFVDYALTQRKINKLQEKLDNEVNLFRKNSMKQAMYIKILYNTMLVLLSIYLIWNNKNKPIIDFTILINKTSLNETLAGTVNSVGSSATTIFYPFDFIFSFPNFSLSNSIGVTIWLFILNRFMDILYNKVTFLLKPKSATTSNEQIPTGQFSHEPMKLSEDIELD